MTVTVLRRSTTLQILRSASALALLASGSAAIASGTQAGTVVNNTARASYSLPNGGTGSVDSNTVSITVDELLDVSVASADGGDVDVTAGLDRAASCRSPSPTPAMAARLSA